MAVNHKVGGSSPPWSEFEQMAMVGMVKLQCPPIKYHPYSPYQMLPSRAMYGVSLGCVSMDVARVNRQVSIGFEVGPNKIV